MGKIIRLTESDLARIIKRVINEESHFTNDDIVNDIRKFIGDKMPEKISLNGMHKFAKEYYDSIPLDKKMKRAKVKKFIEDIWG